MSDPILTERDGAILIVTVNRPPANAIDLATSRVMGEIFRDFRDDPDLRAAILTAAGDRFFCPGWDLKAAAGGDAVDGDNGVGGFGGLQELRDLGKPVIAAVNGIACGGGLEVAMSADIILAAEHATFALPEIRSGTVADAASIKLPKRIPYHVAMEMLLLPFSSQAHTPTSLTGLLAPFGTCSSAVGELGLTSWRYMGHPPQRFGPRMLRKLAVARGLMVYEGLV